MAKKKQHSASNSSSEDSTATAVVSEIAVVQPRAASSGGVDAGAFVGQWQRLVSTTNWDKGRIICQWRDALIAGGAATTEYSDEAWAQLVGGVTSQHVGRLRRVTERFGEVFDQFGGLFWSHFQAALDWQDAEMWLEGAIHNDWSVAQMRNQRCETLGLPSEPPRDVELEGTSWGEQANDAIVAETTTVKGVGGAEPPAGSQRTAASTATDDDSAEEAHELAEQDDDAPFDADGDQPATKAAAKNRARLSVEVDDLPADLADAFEQFKLAIIAQRRNGWRETTADAVIECLDALKALTLAPSDE